jgi:hypothetical protein
LSAAPIAGPPAGGAGEAVRDGRTEKLAAAVFAALVIACFLAFFVTQRLKHRPTSVQQFKLTPNFAPTPRGHHKQELISFKLAHAERATVAIVDEKGNVVATLLTRYPVPRYKQLSLRWNGHRGTALSYATVTAPNGHVYLVPATRGRLAPAGEYRVRLRLSRQREPVFSPRSFTLERS